MEMSFMAGAGLLAIESDFKQVSSFFSDSLPNWSVIVAEDVSFDVDFFAPGVRPPRGRERKGFGSGCDWQCPGSPPWRTLPSLLLIRIVIRK
jgi:hypothetical protein